MEEGVELAVEDVLGVEMAWVVAVYSDLLTLIRSERNLPEQTKTGH